jgi:hypothetical protein
MKVYVVSYWSSYGDYGDYDGEIKGTFSTYKKAKECIEQYPIKELDYRPQESEWAGTYERYSIKEWIVDK